jgi:chromosome segregation ATPase
VLETTQWDLDTLRATIDQRLSALEEALRNPHGPHSLESIIADLARLATTEAQAAAARMCLDARREAEAAILDAHARAGAELAAERSITADLRRRLDSAGHETHTAYETGQEQTRLLAAERNARAELERTVARLEEQTAGLTRQVAAERAQNADLIQALGTAKAAVESELRLNAALRQSLDTSEATNTDAQASLAAAEADRDAERSFSADLQSELTLERKKILDLNGELDIERSAVASLANELERELGANGELQHQLVAERAAAGELRQALDRAQSAAAVRERDLHAAGEALADARSTALDSDHLQAALDLERGVAAALRAERDDERRSAAALRAGLDDARSTGELLGAERDEARSTLAALQAEFDLHRDAVARLHAELDRERTAVTELRGNAAAARSADGDVRQTLTGLQNDFDRQTQLLSQLEAELGDQRQANANSAETLVSLHAEHAELTRLHDAAIGARDSLESQLASERTRANALESVIERLQKAVARSDEETVTVRAALDVVQERIADIQTGRSQTDTEIASLHESIAALRQERDDLTLAIEAERLTIDGLRASIRESDERSAVVDEERRAAVDALRTADDALQDARNLTAALEAERDTLTDALSAARNQVAQLGASRGATGEDGAESDWTELNLDAAITIDEPPLPAPAAPAAATVPSKRYTFPHLVEIKVDNTPAILADLSMTGCRVKSPTPLQPEQFVRIVLPQEPSPVICFGRVVWTRVDDARTPPGSIAGVFFTQCKPSALEEFIIVHGDI